MKNKNKITLTHEWQKFEKQKKKDEEIKIAEDTKVLWWEEKTVCCLVWIFIKLNWWERKRKREKDEPLQIVNLYKRCESRFKADVLKSSFFLSFSLFFCGYRRIFNLLVSSLALLAVTKHRDQAGSREKRHREEGREKNTKENMKKKKIERERERVRETSELLLLQVMVVSCVCGFTFSFLFTC